MNVNDKLDNIVHVSLSRRNLEGLIFQLDEAKKGDPAQIMRRIDENLYIVSAEEDALHYHSSDRNVEARGRAGSSASSQAYDETIEAA